MDENIKDINNSSKEKSVKAIKPKNRRKSPFVRILVMVILLCVAVFGIVIVSDVVTRNNDETEKSAEAVYVTIRVSGNQIYLDGEEVSFNELSLFFENKRSEGAIPETAFITDSLNPADPEILNQVITLLSRYDIDVNADGIQSGSTADEVSVSTNDEII